MPTVSARNTERFECRQGCVELSQKKIKTAIDDVTTVVFDVLFAIKVVVDLDSMTTLESSLLVGALNPVNHRGLHQDCLESSNRCYHGR